MVHPGSANVPPNMSIWSLCSHDKAQAECSNGFEKLQRYHFHNYTSWTNWAWGFYSTIAKTSMRLNLARRASRNPPQHEGPIFHFPAFVINLPSRQDRRRHVAALLSATGFSQLVFPRVLGAEQIDVESLILAGRVKQSAVHRIRSREDLGAAAVGPHIARALGMVDILRTSIAAGGGWLMIAEDDLMHAGDPREVTRALNLSLPSARIGIAASTDRLLASHAHKNHMKH